MATRRRRSYSPLMARNKKRQARKESRNSVLRLVCEGDDAQAAAPELFRTRVVPTSRQKQKQRPRGSNRALREAVGRSGRLDGFCGPAAGAPGTREMRDFQRPSASARLTMRGVRKITSSPRESLELRC